MSSINRCLSGVISSVLQIGMRLTWNNRPSSLEEPSRPATLKPPAAVAAQHQIPRSGLVQRKSSLQLCGGKCGGIRQVAGPQAGENGKVLFSFAGENAAGSDKWPGRKLERTGVELNRREAFGYAFLMASPRGSVPPNSFG